MRIMKLGSLPMAILPAGSATAENPDNFPRQAIQAELNFQDTVMTGISDKEAVADRVEQFGGVLQQTGRFVGHLRQQTGDGRGVEQPLGFEISKHGINDRDKVGGSNLAGLLADHLAGRINQHHGRPGAHTVLTPYIELRIIDHRMLDAVANDRRANIFSELFGRKLGRVDTDHDQFVGVTFTKLTQLRNIMVAVNSTKGPKFQQDKFAAQISHAQGLLCIQPIHIRRKRRGIDFATV